MNRGAGVHTVPAKKGGGWVNKLVGQVGKLHQTKRDAVLFGRAIAKMFSVEHTIHRQDGVISAKNSYGKDAYPPKG